MLLPASIQLVHAIEGHEHIMCVSEAEHHFHQDDVECVLCHLQAENLAVDFSDDYEVIPTEFYTDFLTGKPLLLKSIVLHKKSSRAPPILLFNC